MQRSGLRRGLRIVVLGGSVTVTLDSLLRHRPAGKHEAWPAWLALLLACCWPVVLQFFLYN